MSGETTISVGYRSRIRGGKAKVCSDLKDLEHLDAFNRGSVTNEGVRPMEQSSKYLSGGSW
jgi:hypothetical protein